MIRWALLYGFLVALGFGAGAAACYEITGPVHPCTLGGEGCYPLVHDQAAPGGGVDAGAKTASGLSLTGDCYTALPALDGGAR